MTEWTRMTFFVPGIPRGQARTQSRVLTKPNGEVVRGKNGRPVVTHHKTERQAEDEARISQMLMSVAPERPIQGPVRLYVRAQLPVPKSKSGKWRKSAIEGEILPTTKPDADNVAKHLCDCFTGVIWDDDVQVTRLTVEKRYSEKPGYFVVVEYLEQDEA